MNNGKKNILVVDDDTDTAGLIKQGLEYLYPTEYHVICVNYGKKCFELLEKEHTILDVILMDISIPDMNGLEALDYLKRNPKWRDIPIFIITAMKDSEFKK